MSSMCSPRRHIFFVSLASLVALSNTYQPTPPNDPADAEALTEAQIPLLSTVLQEAVTESTWAAGSSSLADGGTTTDLWNDSLKTDDAKPQPVQRLSQPADVRPARPQPRRRVGLWRSALAALVLTAAIARLYLSSRHVQDDDSFLEEELTQLQNLSAHAKTLSMIFKDESAAKQIQEYRLRVAALHAELAERPEERGRRAARRDVLSERKKVENIQKISTELTQSLLELTWKRLHAKAQGVFAVSEQLTQHVTALTKVSENLKTQEAQVTSELVRTASRAVKQDVRALKTMLKEGDKLLSSPTKTFDESARLLGISAAYAEKIESISVQAQASLARVEDWRGALNSVVAMGALIEGVDVARQIDRLRLDASIISGKGEGSEVVKGFARAQQLVNALLTEVRKESCPLKIASHLSRLKEIGEEAQTRFEELQKLAGQEKEDFPVSHRRNLEYYEKVAKQEANAAELYGSLVNTLITKVTAFARSGAAEAAWHNELISSIEKLVLLSRRVGDTVEDAREGAEDTFAASSVATAAVKANVTKQLLSEVYKDSLEAVRASATCAAWAQLDAAAQEALDRIERSLSLLDKPSNRDAVKAQSVLKLLQDADPKLAVKRYRSSTTLRQGKQQVLSLLRTAKRTESMQMAQELRWMRGSKEEESKSPQ